MPEGTDPSDDVFEGLLPRFIEEMQSTEFYLKVIPQGQFESFWAIAPTIRQVEKIDPFGCEIAESICSFDIARAEAERAEVETEMLYAGYSHFGAAILFVEQDPKLSLEFGANPKDPNAKRIPIPIISHEDAGPYYEAMQLGRELLPRLLTRIAAQDGDIRALKKLRGKGDKELDKSILNLIDALENIGGKDPDRSMSVKQEISLTGSMFSRTARGGRVPVNQLSNIDIPQPKAGGTQRAAENPQLHSGNVGRFSLYDSMFIM